MTQERQQYWKEQIHAALAAHDDAKVAALNTSLTIEVAECMAHQSQRGKETLALCKEIKSDIAELKEHHAADIKRIDDTINAAKHKASGFALAVKIGAALGLFGSGVCVEKLLKLLSLAP